MAKPLVRGAVKTRLAAKLGDDEALAVYERLLLGTLAQAELLEGTDLVLAEAREDGSHAGPVGRPAGRSARRPSGTLAPPRAARRHARRPPCRRVRRSLRRRRRVRRRRQQRQPAHPRHLPRAGVRATWRAAPAARSHRPRPGRRWRLLPHRARRGDVEGSRRRRHRPPHLVTDEHSVAPGLHAARRASTRTRGGATAAVDGRRRARRSRRARAPRR